MTLGAFGSFSSPSIDRESDLLREIEQLRESLARVLNNKAELLAVLEDAVELIGWQVKRHDPTWDGSATPTSILGRASAAIAAAKGGE